MPSEEAGASPPLPLLQHRRWISCAPDPGFLTEEEEGGRGRSVKGSLVRKLCWRFEGGFVFIMPVDKSWSGITVSKETGRGQQRMEHIHGDEQKL